VILEDISTVQVHPELEQDDEVVVSGSDDRPVNSTSKDWTVSNLRDKYERNQIDVQPSFQREYVWRLKPELPSRLIESLLLQIPIPPIYFGKLSDSRFEVIDGQQRLKTLMRFVRNEFALQKLQRMPSLNGKWFRDLSEDYQSRILDADIRSIVIDAGQNDSLRYEVFERLNRGSMALNEQELRNCVYRGPFCDLLAKLENNVYWRKVKGGNVEPRFAEREMILRFFAFAARIEDYGANLKRFLSDYMGVHAPHDSARLSAMEKMFAETMRNVYTVFGEHSGRLYSTGTDDHPKVNGGWETKFSISALDIQASALINQPHAKVQDAAEQIREAYLLYLLTNPQVRLAISRQPASTSATKTRWFGFKGEVQRLLDATIVEPRFFSYAFRRQLYDISPVCQLCGNKIHDFEDSAVDHIYPYSKGGKTEPTNAQLAHRSCNARKWANLSDIKVPVVEKGSRRMTTTVSLALLISRGLITPPLLIERTFKGRRLTALVEKDGQVKWEGTAYATPSGAARAAVSSTDTPDQERKSPETNGWSFWQFEDQDGLLREIDVLRQRYIDPTKVVNEGE